MEGKIWGDIVKRIERDKSESGPMPQAQGPPKKRTLWWKAYNFNFCIIFISRGGRTIDRGSDTRNPTPQPVSQGLTKALVNPTLIRVIAKDMHMAIMTDIQKPKNRI
jgi:hypothetical protein